MARPLEFAIILNCEDPAAEVERLLNMRPNAAALRTIREAEKLDMSRLEINIPKGKANR